MLTFDKCLYLRGRLRLTTAKRLSAYMSSRALATTTASSCSYFYCWSHVTSAPTMAILSSAVASRPISSSAASHNFTLSCRVREVDIVITDTIIVFVTYLLTYYIYYNCCSLRYLAVSDNSVQFNRIAAIYNF